MFEIKINLDRKCKRCRKPGATKNGLCLKCIAKALEKGEYNHILGKVKKEMQDRMQDRES